MLTFVKKFDNLFFENKDFIIKVYDKASDILEGYFGDIEDVEVVMGFMDEKGEESTITAKELLENIELSGLWGFIDEQNGIHIWAKTGVQLDQLIHFFAHELGHSIAGIDACEDKTMQEEMQAEAYGVVANMAYVLALVVKNK